MGTKKKFNKKLLVEGNDDQHVIWALCKKFDIPESFEIVDCQGIDNLIMQIPVRLKTSDITALAIIIDADIELDNRWKSIHSILLNQGFNLPTELPLEGLVIEDTNIRISVWVMPNNYLNGMLEDFISFLVPQEDQLLAIGKDTLQTIEQQGVNKYHAIHRSKALIHTSLAWQQDPGTPMGLAITKRYLTTDEETCLRLVAWLTRAFL